MTNRTVKPKLMVVYDGQCNLCLATVDKLRKMPNRAELAFVSLQSLISEEVQPWPGISDVSYQELTAQMHVTDEQGKRYSGHEGILLLMRHVPSLAWLGRLGGLPGLRVLVRLLYRIVARYRYRLFGKTDCSDGVCQIPRQTHPNGGETDDPNR